MANHHTIRAALPQDVPVIHQLILELAEFEKLTQTVIATEDSLQEHLFGSQPSAEAVLAEAEEDIVGFALFFHNYSTFRGRQGLYLEDLFVKPEHRGQGIGSALLKYLASIALERNCGRFEWAVLDWNQNAIEFYEHLGAKVLQEWRIVRLDETGIQKLGEL